MKTVNFYLSLFVITGMLCAPALAQVELDLPDEQGLIGRGLIGRPNLALDGIDKLYVGIAIDKLYVGLAPNIDPNKDGLVWKELETKVINRLREAGMTVVGNIKTVITVGFDISELCELRVDIDMLKLDDSQKYVFRIQTSLARAVYLEKDSAWSLKSDVWQTHPMMQAVPVQDMPAAVTNVVLQQTQAFISAYHVANPLSDKTPEVNDAARVSKTEPKQAVKPTIKPAVAKYQYLASKNSKVFHKPDCSSAKRISPKNLVSYNTRGEAVKAARRPCKRCKP